VPPAPNDLIQPAMRLYWPKPEAPSILPPGEGIWKRPGFQSREAEIRTLIVRMGLSHSRLRFSLRSHSRNSCLKSDGR